jgi:hypothetical protein
VLRYCCARACCRVAMAASRAPAATGSTSYAGRNLPIPRVCRRELAVVMQQVAQKQMAQACWTAAQDLGGREVGCAGCGPCVWSGGVLTLPLALTAAQ